MHYSLPREKSLEKDYQTRLDYLNIDKSPAEIKLLKITEIERERISNSTERKTRKKIIGWTYYSSLSKDTAPQFTPRSFVWDTKQCKSNLPSTTENHTKLQTNS